MSPERIRTIIADIACNGAPVTGHVLREIFADDACLVDLSMDRDDLLKILAACARESGRPYHTNGSRRDLEFKTIGDLIAYIEKNTSAVSPLAAATASRDSLATKLAYATNVGRSDLLHLSLLNQEVLYELGMPAACHLDSNARKVELLRCKVCDTFIDRCRLELRSSQRPPGISMPFIFAANRLLHKKSAA